MNFGLVGIGKWGRNYIRNILEMEGSELKIICSLHIETYQNLPPEYQLKWTNNYKEVIDSNIDTVIIATHPNCHYEIIKYALENDKNVICEKPCKMQLCNISELVFLAQKKGRIFYTNYINEYSSACSKIKQSIKYSKYSILSLCNFGKGPNRTYSSLWDYGCHELFLAFYLNDSFDYKVKDFFNNKEKYFMELQFNKSKVLIFTGSGYEVRNNSIKCINEESIFWEDDKSENLLNKMLNSFVENKIISNCQYSMEIGKAIRSLDENCLH